MYFWMHYKDISNVTRIKILQYREKNYGSQDILFFHMKFVMLSNANRPTNIASQFAYMLVNLI